MRDIINFLKPKIIAADNGKECIIIKLKDLLNSHNIEHRFIVITQHASLGLIDRFCRTLRELINKLLTSRHTTRYIGVLQSLIDNNSNTYHSTIKSTPNDL